MDGKNKMKLLSRRELFIMKEHRAKEIMESLGYTNVTYKNELVWIENIKGNHQTAFVKNMDSKNEMEVPLEELEESEKKH
jgi:H-type small acid-soluble spore protein